MVQNWETFVFYEYCGWVWVGGWVGGWECNKNANDCANEKVFLKTSTFMLLVKKKGAFSSFPIVS